VASTREFRWLFPLSGGILTGGPALVWSNTCSPTNRAQEPKITDVTLSIAIRRPGFVVLGADRLSSWVGEPRDNEPWGIEVCKIALHPTLPVGAVHSGVAELGGMATVDLISQFLRTLPQDVASDPAACANILALLLHQPLKQLRSSAPSALLDHIAVRIALGILSPDGSHLIWMTIDDSVKLERVGTGVIKPTEALEGFYTAGQYSNENARIGSDSEDLPRTLSRVQRLLAVGIAEEERRLTGKGIKCGFGADVAVIDAAGGRFVKGGEQP
jgi:hypothetical protein